MDNSKLFEKLSKRDFTNSAADEYAQLLQTLHHHLFAAGEVEGFYTMLETANKKGERIEVIEDSIICDELFLSDLVISSKTALK